MRTSRQREAVSDVYHLGTNLRNFSARQGYAISMHTTATCVTLKTECFAVLHSLGITAAC